MSNSKHIQVPSAEYGCAAASAFSDEDIVSSTVLSPAILSPAVSALSPRLSAFVLHWIYDYKNQLTSVTIKDGAGNTVSASAYLYDPSGARIYAKDVAYSGATVTSSLTTYYPTKNYSEVWDNLTGKKTKVDEHVYAGDLAVATVEYTPNASGVLTPKTYYNIVDQRGSTQVSTDASGAVVELSDYYAYGNVRSVSNTSTFSEQRKYIGQYHDVVTSLEYLNARYYNSNYGRFVSQDPVFWNFDEQWLRDPQNQNAYAYARNNPIILSDPSGRIAPLLALGLAVGAGAAVGGMAGIIGQGISDYAMHQPFEWENYAGAFAGGAVTGGTAVISAGASLVWPLNVPTGLFSGAVNSSVSQGLKIADGNQTTDFSFAAVRNQALITGGTSLIPGLNIPGITSGTGSFASVSGQIITKITKGIISNVAPTTVGKMVVSAAANNFVGDLASGAIQKYSSPQTVNAPAMSPYTCYPGMSSAAGGSSATLSLQAQAQKLTSTPGWTIQQFNQLMVSGGKSK